MLPVLLKKKRPLSVVERAQDFRRAQLTASSKNIDLP